MCLEEGKATAVLVELEPARVLLAISCLEAQSEEMARRHVLQLNDAAIHDLRKV